MIARNRERLYEPLPPPYGVTLHFFIEAPRTSKYRWPVGSDLDKLVRGTLDGLQEGRLILDDKHVTKLATDKTPTTATSGGGSRAYITVQSFAHLY